MPNYYCPYVNNDLNIWIVELYRLYGLHGLLLDYIREGVHEFFFFFLQLNGSTAASVGQGTITSKHSCKLLTYMLFHLTGGLGNDAHVSSVLKSSWSWQVYFLAHFEVASKIKPTWTVEGWKGVWYLNTGIMACSGGKCSRRRGKHADLVCLFLWLTQRCSCGGCAL